ncbi:DUF2974 domain-containing protein [Alkaliphilus transvaalensis]|uniref:DUF2974 domain-containing protein n=1 Tax=Alkaliphilus transvaalensis TaxID=114628 RepID=UPI000479F653|nr:DUF2974 domain-containing protein [Alkaliphilus transvaalensis]
MNGKTNLELTDRQYLLLAALAYLDVSNEEDRKQYDETIELQKGKNITELTQHIKDEEDKIALYERHYNGTYKENEEGQLILMEGGSIGLNGKDEFTFEYILDEISKDPLLSRLVIKDHVNDNLRADNDKGTGFVGYAFEDPETGAVFFAFRGSEEDINPFKAIDWKNNFFYSLISESIQYQPAKDFFDKNKTKDGINYLAGHSLGGSLVQYILALEDNAIGRALNGKGLSPLALLRNPSMYFKLMNADFINYATYDDFVSSALLHIGKRIYVSMQEGSINGFIDPHYLFPFEFDENGSLMGKEEIRTAPIPLVVEMANADLMQIVATIQAFGNLALATVTLRYETNAVIEEMKRGTLKAVGEFGKDIQDILVDFVDNGTRVLVQEIQDWSVRSTIEIGQAIIKREKEMIKIEEEYIKEYELLRTELRGKLKAIGENIGLDSFDQEIRGAFNEYQREVKMARENYLEEVSKSYASFTENNRKALNQFGLDTGNAVKELVLDLEEGQDLNLTIEKFSNNVIRSIDNLLNNFNNNLVQLTRNIEESSRKFIKTLKEKGENLVGKINNAFEDFKSNLKGYDQLKNDLKDVVTTTFRGIRDIEGKAMRSVMEANGGLIRTFKSVRDDFINTTQKVLGDYGEKSLDATRKLVSNLVGIGKQGAIDYGKAYKKAFERMATTFGGWMLISLHNENSKRNANKSIKNTIKGRAIEGVISVTPQRIKELASRAKILQRDLESAYNNVNGDTERLLTDCNRQYSEFYVRQAVEDTRRELAQVRQKAINLDGSLGRLSKRLQDISNEYIMVEKDLVTATK